MLFREHYYNRMSSGDHTPNARHLHEATVTLKNVLLGKLQTAPPSLDIPRSFVFRCEISPFLCGLTVFAWKVVELWELGPSERKWVMEGLEVYRALPLPVSSLFLGVPLACSLLLCLPFLNGWNPLRLLTKISLSSLKWLLSGIW